MYTLISPIDRMGKGDMIMRPGCRINQSSEVLTPSLFSPLRTPIRLHLLCVITTCVLPSYVFAAAVPGRLLPGEIADTPLAATPQPAQPSSAALPALHIAVIGGEGAVNILSANNAQQPVVQVSGKNNEPVAGVLVTFTAPSIGPGALFLNGSRSVGVMTDAAGRTRLVGMQPTGLGAFKLNVKASLEGQSATATISQINYATVATATAAGAPGYGTPSNSAATGAHPAGLSTKAKAGIIAGIGAAALLGVVVALNHGGNSSVPTAAVPIPTASIGLAGTPTPGAPH